MHRQTKNERGQNGRGESLWRTQEVLWYDKIGQEGRLGRIRSWRLGGMWLRGRRRRTFERVYECPGLWYSSEPPSPPVVLPGPNLVGQLENICPSILMQGDEIKKDLLVPPSPLGVSGLPRAWECWSEGDVSDLVASGKPCPSKLAQLFKIAQIRNNWQLFITLWKHWHVITLNSSQYAEIIVRLIMYWNSFQSMSFSEQVKPSDPACNPTVTRVSSAIMFHYRKMLYRNRVMHIHPWALRCDYKRLPRPQQMSNGKLTKSTEPTLNSHVTGRTRTWLFRESRRPFFFTTPPPSSLSNDYLPSSGCLLAQEWIVYARVHNAFYTCPCTWSFRIHLECRTTLKYAHHLFITNLPVCL